MESFYRSAKRPAYALQRPSDRPPRLLWVASAMAPQRPSLRRYAALARTLATVARLQPVAACIADHDMPERSIPAMPALRAVSSGRPR
jgi:hypothetical protein